MVALLPGFPPHVAAYRASGAISREEYEQVVMARVDEVAARYGKINFLVRLETDIDNYSIGAFFNYLKVSFEHFSKWNRMAIVTDQRMVGKIFEVLGKLVPGEIRGYRLEAFEDAKDWVSAPLA